MRILVITASLTPTSGWGRYSLSVISELRALGHEVVVCAEDTRGAPLSVASLYGPSSSNTLWRIITGVFRVRRAARGADVVHAFDGWPYSIYGLCAVMGTKRKLFVSGIATYSVPPAGFSVKTLLFRAAYARARRIMCVSKFTLDRIVERGISKEKCIVVHMGAPRLPMPEPAYASSMLKHFSIPQDAYPAVLTVGQIKERKGQLDMVRAIEMLKKEYPNALYIMAGSADQDYLDKIWEYAASRELTPHIRVIHNASDADIAVLYERADMVALMANTDPRSGHFEGFGLSVLEGYQFGKPALGSTGSGVAEAVKSGATGEIADQRSPEDIAGKVRRILKIYDTYATNAAAEYANYSWERTARAYIHEYERD